MRIYSLHGRILIEGRGAEFLRLKAMLVARLSPQTLNHMGPGKLSADPLRLRPVAAVLLNSECDITEDARQILLSGVSSLARHIEAKAAVSTILERSRTLTGSTHWDRILDPNQGIAVNAMVVDGLHGLCLFDEQGVGKTVTAIAAFDILRSAGEVERMFVVAPKNMLGEWEKEFVRFAPNRYSTVVLSGDRSKRLWDAHKPADVLIMNFESVTPLLVSLKGLASSKRTLLVVDESFFVKNPAAARSVSVRALRVECVKAFVLCGTPAPNRPADIIHQFDVADNGLTFEGFHPAQDASDADSIVDRIQERGVYLRRLKQDVLSDLPVKQFQLVRVRLGGQQLRLYEEARKELVIFLRTLDNRTFRRGLTTYFQKRAVLLQLCVSPRLVDPLYGDVPAKYLRLDTLLESILSDSKRKVVLWSYYRGSLDDLEKRYAHYGIVRIDGTVTTVRDRTAAVAKFQTDSAVRIFLGNPAAAGAGITLHAASDAVYVSWSNQAAHYLQSLDRIHRRGQRAQVVQYHLLICEGTVEESEIARLRAKERDQHRLLGDHIEWPSSLDEALAELGFGA